MCGRFNLRTTPAQLAQTFNLIRELDFSPRYNIAPTQQVPVVRRGPAGNVADMLRWGLIPMWAKDLKIGASMINARADTVASKPAFRAAFKRRRCLIPATGFYEWHPGPGKVKQPFHIHCADDQLIAFAGLWECWDQGEDPLESCAIITTDGNALMQPIHNRMPVILPRAVWDVWLDHEVDQAALLSLLVPDTEHNLIAEPVSTDVNNARNERPDVLRPQET